MGITRRDFLKYCSLSAAVLGLSGPELLRLEESLAKTDGPTVLWLQGAACTGCSMSFLNRISSTGPASAADILVNYINLAYHPNLMALAGQDAAQVAKDAFDAGGYVLAVEGGVPTAFGGAACWAWNYNKQDVTFKQVVQDLGGKALAILSIGTCASFGGIPAAPPNPTGVQSVSQVTGRPTINIAGCPPHPDWITWVVAQLLIGTKFDSTNLDNAGRPRALYGATVHENCPRLNHDRAITFGVDGTCSIYMGCQGPVTHCNCPTSLWNNGVNWCVDANGRCLGCTEPTFPGTELFPYAGSGNEEHNASFISRNTYNCTNCHRGPTVGHEDD